VENEFARLLEESFNRLSGEVIVGKVVKVTKHEVFVDFGWKSEGVVPIKEFEEVPKVGDEVEVCIVERETDEGYALLSVNCAKNVKRWFDSAKEVEEKGVVKGVIKQKVRGGFKVKLDNGLMVFLPLSQVDIMPISKPDEWLEREITAKVISVDRKRKSIVISRRKLLEEERSKKRKETLKNIKEGDIVEGIVKNVVDFGIFVDVDGVDGLVHKSDISWSGLKSPFDCAKIGDRIRVKVKKVERDKERLVLSIKEITEDPWKANVEEKFKVGSVVKGIPVMEGKKGLWVELPGDVAGFLPYEGEQKDFKFRFGQEYEFSVVNVDRPKRRVILKWEPQK